MHVDYGVIKEVKKLSTRNKPISLHPLTHHFTGLCIDHLGRFLFAILDLLTSDHYNAPTSNNATREFHPCRPESGRPRKTP